MGGRGKLPASAASLQRAIDHQRGFALVTDQTNKKLEETVEDISTERSSQKRSTTDYLTWPVPPDAEPTNELLTLIALRNLANRGVNRVSDSALRQLVENLRSGRQHELMLGTDGTLISSVANHKLYRIRPESVEEQIRKLT